MVVGLVPLEAPVGPGVAEAGSGAHHVVECLLEERGRSTRSGWGGARSTDAVTDSSELSSPLASP